VLVIGSGFGGSVSALRLAEKGYRVGVLESGRRFEDADFPRTSWDIRRFIILAGAGVGGGSLVYANTLYRPDSDSFYGDRQWAGMAAKEPGVLVPDPFFGGTGPLRRDAARWANA
jgi:cholesterol oxidase